MTKLEQALDIAERLTKYTLWKSMNQLKKRLKIELKSAGLQDQTRFFKLKKSGEYEVNVHIKSGLEPSRESDQ